MGGCGWATDPRTASSTRDGRTWSIPNLWICDGSLFPTSGGRQSVADHPGARLPDRRPDLGRWPEEASYEEGARQYRQHRGSAPARASRGCRSRSWTMSRAGSFCADHPPRQPRRPRRGPLPRAGDVRCLEPQARNDDAGRESGDAGRDRPDWHVRRGLVQRRNPLVPRRARFRHPLLAFNQRLALDRGRRKLGRASHSGSSSTWRRTAASRRTCSNRQKRPAARC